MDSHLGKTTSPALSCGARWQKQNMEQILYMQHADIHIKRVLDINGLLYRGEGAIFVVVMAEMRVSPITNVSQVQ